MNILFQFNRQQILRHIFIWALIISYINFDSPLPGYWLGVVVGSIIESLNYIIVFYSLSLLVFPLFWSKRKMVLGVLGILTCFFFYSSVTYLNYLNIVPYLGGYSHHLSYPISDLLLGNLFNYFIIVLAAIATYYYRSSVLKIKYQSEKEKLLIVKELNFLKNQFNSHITFNFLNYCYSRIHSILPEISDLISLFAGSLRYIILNKPDEKVTLNTEIGIIDNYIKLHKSMNANLDITFCYKGKIDHISIYPRILSSFVEDILEIKIHDVIDKQVQINLNVSKFKLKFNVVYSGEPFLGRIDQEKQITSIFQTLDLYYHDRYSLNFKSENEKNVINIFLDISDNKIKSKKNSIADNNSSIINNGNDYNNEVIPLRRLSKSQIQKHFLVWVALIVHTNIKSSFDGPLASIIISNVLFHLNYIFVFYSFRLYIFPKYWEGGKGNLILLILAVLALYWINVYYIFKLAMPAMGVFVEIEQYSLLVFLKERFYYFVIFGSAGVFAFFTRYGLYKLKQQEQIEKMLLGKELYFLKHQFNSPLTFRFLAYCSNQIQEHSPQTSHSINLFSDMLQYTLRTAPDEKVPLQQEITYIENFISIQKLLSEKVYVDFKCTGDAESRKIVSRILVTFVENAFKHGIFNDPGFPIHIRMAITGQELVFTIRNRINPGKRIDSTKKGIENVTQILELYYPGKHRLRKYVYARVYNIVLAVELSANC
jgi:two-component system, LytTR family, sensor kinase